MILCTEWILWTEWILTVWILCTGVVDEVRLGYVLPPGRRADNRSGSASHLAPVSPLNAGSKQRGLSTSQSALAPISPAKSGNMKDSTDG